MASKVNPTLPDMTDPADISVISNAIQSIVNSYNPHLDETEGVIEAKVVLLEQIVNQVSLFSSDVSAALTSLKNLNTPQEKLPYLVQIVNEIALFNSANAGSLLTQLNNL